MRSQPMGWKGKTGMSMAAGNSVGGGIGEDFNGADSWVPSGEVAATAVTESKSMLFLRSARNLPKKARFTVEIVVDEWSATASLCQQ